MTVRGGGAPTSPLAFTPTGRMGPPLRSFAADAHDCIMVRVLGPTGYKVVARLNRARSGLPSDRYLRPRKRAVALEAVKAKAKHAARLVQRPTLTARRPGRSAGRAKETVFEIEHKTDEGQKICCLANSLTTKAPYKGLGADSEEKREPASDIDTVVVDSLKALDPKWPIREADIR